MNTNANIPSTAIVLAGGFGTRLRAVVADVPKPMAPIANRPFLAYLLDQLAQQGIQQVVLAVGFKGELIEASFGESHGPIKLVYSYEDKPLGTGGAIAKAMQLHNSDSNVWIVNGDTYFDCDFRAVAKTHEQLRAEATLALCAVDNADRYGLVELDRAGFITRFQEKTPGASGLINAGVYLLDPNALLRYDLGETFSLERDFFEKHLLDIRLAGSPQPGYFIDIGIPEDYHRAIRHFG